VPDTGDGCDGELPFVTVVMPVRNEMRFIGASLAAVLRQDYPAGRLEVIIADGMSTDGTLATIDDLRRRAGPGAPSVAVVSNPDRSTPAGLNLAVTRARGAVIVRVDGHCEVQADYVRRCVLLLEQTGADNVGGTTVGVGDRPWQRAVARAVRSPFGVGSASVRYAPRARWVDTVFLGAWRRDVFDRVGLFDEELLRNQDDEHNFRILQSGGRVWLEPSICTRHEVRGTLPALWQQYYEYGLYKVRVMQKRRGVASWRHVVPAVFVASMTVTVVAGAFTRRRRLMVAVVGPYAAATTVASVHAGRDDPGALLLLPVAFATVHVAYGTGFLAGLWKWRRFHRR
jgi:glycosyltransferase involved in cell wall biosynthesis